MENNKDKFQELIKDVIFHPFNKNVMLKRRKLRKSDENESISEDIKLDEYTLNKLNQIVEDEGITMSELVNDFLYDMMNQLTNTNSSDLEIIDSVYMSHNIDNLIDSGKDYCIVDTVSKQKVVLITNKDTIDLYNKTSQKVEKI